MRVSASMMLYPNINFSMAALVTDMNIRFLFCRIWKQTLVKIHVDVLLDLQASLRRITIESNKIMFPTVNVDVKMKELCILKLLNHILQPTMYDDIREVAREYMLEENFDKYLVLFLIPSNSSLPNEV